MKTPTFRLLLATALLLLATATFAQENILFSEEFDNNKRQWWIGDYAGYTTTLEDGKLVFRNKDVSFTHYVLQDIYINPAADFIIGAKIKILDDKNYANGLAWGVSDKKRKTFGITKNGYFRIAHDTKEGEDVEVDFTQSPHIYTDGRVNNIAVAKKGEMMYYFVNGKVVHTGFFGRIYGSGHGLMLGNGLVEVESFIIKHPPIKIDVDATGALVGKKENLGPSINSYGGEIAPRVSADGKTLFVCRARHEENLGGRDDQDAWFSTRNADDSWSTIQNMQSPINDEKQNSVAAVSPDQNTLLLNYDGRDDPGLMRTVRTASGWSKPERVQIDDFYNDNIDAEFAFAPDNKVLVYSVERKDSYGDKDLYVSFLKPDGSWTAPKHMGPVINTFSTDFGPFIAADGRTLYYGSTGLPGYGSSDIYVTRRLDDTWTNWSPPKNLGPAINTSDWDAYYTITASGEEAYLATAGQYGTSDIFRIKIEKPKEDPVVLIKGRVLDQKTKKPLGASIVYENLKNGKELGIARTNPRTGEFQIVLPYGVDYGFRAGSKGYIAVSEHIDLSVKGKYSEIERDLYLAPIAVGETVVMQNVFFEKASANLLPTSYPELDRVVRLMKENTSLQIKIKGHTDNLGVATKLLELSKLRAAAVRKFLQDKGIDPSRMQEEGYGGTKPIGNNDNPEERAKNRRVEFEILKY